MDDAQEREDLEMSDSDIQTESPILQQKHLKISPNPQYLLQRDLSAISAPRRSNPWKLGFTR